MNAVTFFNLVKKSCQELRYLSPFLNELSGFDSMASLENKGMFNDAVQLQERYRTAATFRKQGLEIINRLPDIRWAVCLRRYYLDDWPISGIAGALDVSVRTVWNYRRDALAWIDDGALIEEEPPKVLAGKAAE